MKKNIYVFALSAVLGATTLIGAPQVSSSAAGQPAAGQAQSAQTDTQSKRHGRHADAQHQVDRLAKRLQLTTEQQSQLLPILAQRTEQMKALRNDTSLTADDRRTKFRELRQDSNAQIRNVLTDTQKQQYDAMLQQARGGRKRHGAGSGSAI